MNYILTGRPGSGKSTLASWLCDRLPQPAAGVRTLCTGRCGAGPIFSLQDLLTGQMVPISRPAEGRMQGIPEAFEGFGADALRRAAQSGAAVVLADEVGRFERDCAGYLAELARLADGPQILVAAVKKEDLPHLNALRSRAEDVQIDLDAMTPAEARALLARQLPAPLHPGVSLRLFREEKCFGPGPAQILDLVARTGSLHSAAAGLGMSYSKAWKLLGEMERQWGFAMLERRPGGAGGGGSTLTPRAWELLARFRALEWETRQAAARGFARHFADFR